MALVASIARIVILQVLVSMLSPKLLGQAALLASVLRAPSYGQLERQTSASQVLLDGALKTGVNDVIVQLFGWDWYFVAHECTQYLGPMGYGYVQVSPPQETIQGPQWWTDYQPVSFNLTSKRGNREQFKTMVETCASAGVGVIADTVLNHAAGVPEGVGTGGTSFTKYSYPQFSYDDFHHCNNGHDDVIWDYTNRTDVQECELVRLADRDTKAEHTRAILAEYVNDLLSLGAVGLRLDAAKHMAASSLRNITSRLHSKPYIVQEVIYGHDEAIQPEEYADIGDVFAFQAARDLKRMFLSDGIKYLLEPIAWGSGWGDGYLASNLAATFVTNHDTERDSSTLRSDSPKNAYVLATVFLLGFNYGSPSVFSGYDFSTFDQGVPEMKCDQRRGGFRCEHRWQAINNMVRFRTAVYGLPVGHIVSGSIQQVAFARGDVGYVIINNSGDWWKATWQTGLPQGSYCDVIHDTDPSPTRCEGTWYQVDSAGFFEAAVSPYDAVALYVGGA